MTREEALRYVKSAAGHLILTDRKVIGMALLEACDVLRGPQPAPDPDTALTALREKAERERGCAYCVIGKRSPDAEYCSNCGRKLTPSLPELANESEEVNPDSHQYVDNYSTNRRKSVKQMGRNLYSETAETCTLRCEYCGKYTQDSDLSTEWVGDKYLMCSKCKEKHT